jgi:alpha-tubulin suppressor-like RCC1 family protein
MYTKSLLVPGALLLAALACHDDSASPTTPTTATREMAVSPAAALSFRLVSPGGSHTCGVTTDDHAYCWGVNRYGALGDSTWSWQPTYRMTPVPVAGGFRFRQVSAGGAHTCAVTPDNQAYCWGDNITGNLGNGGSAEFYPYPVPVAGGILFRQVSAGRNYTCGVSTADQLYCWGRGESDVPVAVADGLRFRQVSVGGHVCAITTENRAYCWGFNGFGELGDGTTTSRTTPTLVAGGRRFVQINAGEYHTCAVNAYGRPFCWGNNTYGQLGDGTATQRLTPVRVTGGLTFRRVDPGVWHTCGVTQTDRAYCWGRNDEGQLGDGTKTLRTVPTPVLRNLPFRRVETGTNHTCGSTTADVGYCWGSNAFGKIGDGTFHRRLRPWPIAGTT